MDTKISMGLVVLASATRVVAILELEGGLKEAVPAGVLVLVSEGRALEGRDDLVLASEGRRKLAPLVVLVLASEAR